MQKVLLTTGGTGGHIFPALAVAEVLREQNVQMLFVGSQYGPEAELVTKADVPFEGLAVRGILGRGIKAFSAGLAMLKAIMQAVKILKKFQPEVVVGFGGYASFASVFAAKLLRIPLAIHEQNAVPGVSNKILGAMANKVFLSLEAAETKKAFSASKCIVTGNPVRASLAAVGTNKDLSPEARDFTGKHLLIIGGSQGAKAINSAIIEHLPTLKELGISICHQTGKADFDRVIKAYEDANMPMGTDSEQVGVCEVSAFVHHMDKAYAKADLVLCRSGASTMAELAAVGRGAVLVPFPYATHNHQWFNAKNFADVGAALVIEEKNMHEQDCMGQVVRLLNDANTLQKMALAAHNEAKVEAAQDIVKYMRELV